jgi:hypothetical protein
VAKKIISAKSPDCGKFGSMTRYAMKLDIQSKNLLPDSLYTTGTFAAIIDGAKYYNGTPTQDSTTPSISTSKSTVSTKKILLFYRAYTK